MRSERLGWEHKDVLHRKLRDINAPLSEYSFPNLYLFRDSHQYEVLFDKEIFIKGRSYDGFTYLMPTAPVAALDRDYLKGLMSGVDFLFPVPEEWLGFFSPDEFEISFREGDADYLYTVEKMSTYGGRKLHKKRNLLKQFVESYEHEALPLTNDRLVHARFVLDDWQKESGTDPRETDYGPCREALDRYEELVLCGGVYFADSEPAGFVLGEELNRETFVLHFAKARTKFKGIYQYLYNNFAKVLPPQYRYLNLEQDMDKENLRIFKSSYVPEVLLKKARVRLKR